MNNKTHSYHLRVLESLFLEPRKRPNMFLTILQGPFTNILFFSRFATDIVQGKSLSALYHVGGNSSHQELFFCFFQIFSQHYLLGKPCCYRAGPQQRSSCPVSLEPIEGDRVQFRSKGKVLYFDQRMPRFGIPRLEHMLSPQVRAGLLYRDHALGLGGGGGSSRETGAAALFGAPDPSPRLSGSAHGPPAAGLN